MWRKCSASGCGDYLMMFVIIRPRLLLQLLAAILAIIFISTRVKAQVFAPDSVKNKCSRIPQSEGENSICQNLLKKYPNDPDLYFNIGNYFSAIKHDYESARSWDKKGIDTAPQYYRSFIISALLATWDKNYDIAIDSLNKAISINQNDSFAYKNRAAVWGEKRDYDNAIADISKAISLNPRNGDLYRVRSEINISKREYSNAINDADLALKLDQTNALAFENRCLALLHQDKVDKAIRDCGEAIKLDRQNASAFGHRGLAWFKKRQYDKAMVDYNESIHLDPKIQSVYLNRSVLLSYFGDYNKALSDVTKSIELDPRDAIAYNNRCNLWNKNGDYDKAIMDCNEAIYLDRREVFAYSNRGLAWLKKGDYDKAISDYNEAINLKPDFEDAKDALRIALIKKAKASERRQNERYSQNSSSEVTKLNIATGKRVALVIGNGAYKSVPVLENPTRDAMLFADTLHQVGFDEVTLKLNLSREQMLAALDDFQKTSSKSEWAAIYFAGHGIEVSGMNYLLPIDVKAVEDTSVSTQTVNMEYFLNSAEAAKQLRLVIIDACRNNPFAQQIRTAAAPRGTSALVSASIGKGLGRIEPEPGTLVVYAAKAGAFALDGDGQNSPFVIALVRRITEKPPIEVRRVFDFVREDVVETTKKEQQPFAYGSLSAKEDFYFTPK